MALKWKKDEDGNHVSHDGNFRVSKTNYHPSYGFAHDSGEKATFWMLSKKDTKLGSAPDYFVNHRSHMSLSKAKAAAADWHKRMNEGKLAPVWSGTTDQIQNMIWKKKEIGRKARGILHKRGKSSVEKRRPVGEDSTPLAGLGAGAMVSVEPSIMNPRDPILGKKKTMKNVNKTPKDIVEMRESIKNSLRRLRTPPQLPGPKGGFPVPAGKERIKDGYGMNTIREPLKKHTDSETSKHGGWGMSEDVGAVPNSVGGGMSPTVGGEGNIKGVDPIMGQKPLRRKRFAGKEVFVVDPTTFHKAYLGKRKYEHYEKYLEGCDIADEIREYGRKYWDEPIIIENEQTGAMVYLKYGSK